MTGNGQQWKEPIVIEMVSQEEYEAMSKYEREDYLMNLTTEQYETMEIYGGLNGITSKHDYKLKSLEKRCEWTEKTVKNSFDEYCIGLANIPLEDRPFLEQKVPRALDMMGKYILDSADVESERKLEYSFYMNEQQYAKRSIAKGTIPFDPIEALSVFENGRTLQDQVKYEDRMDYLINLIDLDNMSYKQRRKMISTLLLEKDNPESYLQEDMQKLYDSMLESPALKKESNRDIFEYMIQGLTETDMAKEIGCTRQNISEKIKRIIEDL